jgi:hypothetical protein
MSDQREDDARATHVFASLAFVALMIVALAACAAWFLLRRGAAAAAAEAVALRHEEAARFAADAARSSATTASRPTDPTATVARTPYAAPESAPAPALDGRLLVLDGVTGVPVPDAEVTWREPSATDDADAPPAAPPTRTDAEGLAAVPRRARLAVTARAGDRRGGETVDTRSRAEARVRIYGPPRVAIRVVDVHGRPAAGVPVSARIGYDYGQASFESRGRTKAPDGEFVPERRTAFFGAGRPTLLAGLEGPWARSGLKKNATESELRDGPLTLTLPPTAPLEVRVAGPDGAPLGASARVLLALELAAHGAPDRRKALEARTDDAGVARFSHAPAGEIFAVLVAAPAYASAVAAVGPLTPDAAATVEVRLGARMGVAGLALDADGRPLARAALEIELTAPQGVRPDAAPATTTTDADGRFRFEIDGSAAGPAARAALTVREDGAVPRAGQTPLGDVSGRGTTDLGDVVLRRRVFAGGRVIDAAGAPVPGARVVVHSSVAHATTPGAGGPGRLGEAVADAGGSFLIPWPPAAEPHEPDVVSYVLQALPPENPVDAQLMPRTPMTPGAEAWVLQLPPYGALVGRVVLPPAPPLGRLNVRARSTADLGASSLGGPRTYSVPLDRAGRFRFGGLPPGEYDVMFELEGRRDLVGAVDRVFVRAGATEPDPRLDGVLLTGLDG